MSSESSVTELNNKETSGLRAVLHKYRHAWTLIYLPIYLLWFFTLEGIVARANDVHIIHSALDDMIPFVEVFAIPYYFWFFFMAGTGIYYFFTDREDYYRFCIFLFTGMSFCLLICTLWHNGLNLRPDLETIGRDNVFIRMMKAMYKTDTPQNVCPSIHVVNSIGVAISVFHSVHFKNKKAAKIGSVVIAALICISTVFLKQHSVVDVFFGVLTCVPLYFLAYRTKLSKVESKV